MGFFQSGGHVFWRQLMHEDFLDVIFDCPYELHELVEDAGIYPHCFALIRNHRESCISAPYVYTAAPACRHAEAGLTATSARRVLMLKKIHEKLICAAQRQTAAARHVRSWIS